jgi:ATP-dependent DNA helicase DinG
VHALVQTGTNLGWPPQPVSDTNASVPSTAANPTFAFQEGLALEPAGRFLWRGNATTLGIDPDLLGRLTEPGPLCFLDFEATGLDTETEAPIEAGAVLVVPGTTEVAVFNSYIRTEIPLSPFIQRLTGITPEDIRSAPGLEDVARALDGFIGDAPVVAHNADFERAWLVRAFANRFVEHPFLDTIELFALVYPDLPNMKLDTLCRSKLGRRERHRALDDALDTLRIVTGIFAEARDGQPHAANAHASLRAYRPSSPWTSRLAAAPTSTVRRAPVTVPESETATPALAPVDWDFDSIAARLKDEAACRRVLPGYQLREGQIELLRAAFDAFAGRAGKSVRVCEAGTGIGKTLAYLSVAIPFARRTGEQVIISTSSKLLQGQLIEKDLPTAATLLGYTDLRYSFMKGRANYVCRRRLDRFLDRESRLFPQPDSFPLAFTCAFSRTAGHGQLDRIPGVLFAMHPDLEKCRREATSSDAGECSRKSCEMTQGSCAFREARQRLDAAEILVVNHDLLLRWPPDYPPLRHLIVDEAHELPERADGAYAASVEALELVHRIETALGRKGDAALLKDERGKRLAEQALDMIAAVAAEARGVVTVEVGASGYRDELPVPLEGPRESENWKKLVDGVVELARVLEELGSRLADSVPEDDGEEHPAAGPATVLLEAKAVLNEAFPSPSADRVVRFRGLARQTPTWRLTVTPVSPAANFQDEILDKVTTLFATSATVSVGDDLRGSLGLLELPERAGTRFAVHPSIPSPFDYRRNLEVLFVDERFGRDELVRRTTQVVATLARKLGGRTLALFTSRDRMATVADELFRSLSPEGFSIIAPSTGNTDPHDLVRTFLDAEQAVLLGARAFWQGVDIPGDACQAVVIEKLPFDVPGDPLIQRRGELIERDGGNSFMDFMLPRMLLRLKQMIGRLIRTPTDRGVVVIVEPRCEKRYFQAIYEALPPASRHARVRVSDLERTLDEFFASR